MLDTVKEDCRPATFAEPNDITLSELLRFLGSYTDHRVVFQYDGKQIKPGYHITEVKAGQFSALDCGANPECWTEIFVQLWDVNEGDDGHMKAGKFSAIIRKVSEHLGLDGTVKLTFEVSDGVAAMQLHRAGAPEVLGDVISIDLSPRPASCKPRDRWLEEQQSCCGEAAAKPCFN